MRKFFWIINLFDNIKYKKKNTMEKKYNIKNTMEKQNGN